MAYRRILLCVDNSEFSRRAATHAGSLGRGFGAVIVVAHVYAARLHDRRFEDLEPSLPAENRRPEALEASRRTHGRLIGDGLRLISDSYIDAAVRTLEDVSIERRSLEGKHHVALLQEATDRCDLAILGAWGLGAESMNGQPRSGLLGSVCERVLRRARTDVLIARGAAAPQQPIVVGIDGSPGSFAALLQASRIAAVTGAKLEAVACFDPSFHPVAFKAITGVLSNEARELFRFDQQKQLHDRIIDHGLERLYRGYLETARAVARARGQEIESRLLEGKPAHEITFRARQVGAGLLVLGRFGQHCTEDSDIGSTAERTVRLFPGNTLVVMPPSTDCALPWTEAATQRLARVPEALRAVVRRAIENHARALGVQQVTEEVVSAAKKDHGVPLPGHTGEEA